MAMTNRMVAETSKVRVKSVGIPKFPADHGANRHSQAIDAHEDGVEAGPHRTGHQVRQQPVPGGQDEGIGDT